MLVLGLFVLQLYDLLVELVAVTLDLFLLVLRGLHLVLVAILHVFELLLQRLCALLLPCQLVLGLSQLRLSLLHLGAHLLAEVDVANSLLHHEIDRVDRVLDVVRLCAEKIANGWHTVALLRLPNVLQVVH